MILASCTKSYIMKLHYSQAWTVLSEQAPFYLTYHNSLLWEGQKNVHLLCSIKKALKYINNRVWDKKRQTIPSFFARAKLFYPYIVSTHLGSFNRMSNGIIASFLVGFICLWWLRSKLAEPCHCSLTIVKLKKKIAENGINEILTYSKLGSGLYAEVRQTSPHW